MGPAIGSLIYAQYGASWVFLLNALSYVADHHRARPGPAPRARSQPAPRASTGCSRASATPGGHRVVGRCLGDHLHLLAAGLPFITQMPTLADENLGIWRPRPSPTASSTAPSGWARSSARCRSAPCSPDRRRPSSPASACSVFAGLLTRLRAAPGGAARLPGHLRPRRRLLRRDHLALDRAAGGPRRQRAGQGHGPLDHGLRRHRALRRPGRRLDRERTSITTDDARWARPSPWPWRWCSTSGARRSRPRSARRPGEQARRCPRRWWAPGSGC